MAVTIRRADGTTDRAPEPCVHLGAPAPPPGGESPLKSWSLCDHPDRPLGPIVCPCLGCGPTCPGYPKGDE